MDLIDALCIVVNSWNAGRPEDLQVYRQALDMVEAHSELALFRERQELTKAEAKPLIVNNVCCQSTGEMQ
jgi:hypothetical protein